MFFLLYKHTDDGVFDDFPKISDHFQLPTILQNYSKGHTNVAEHFPKIAKDFRGRPEDVWIIHQRIEVQFKVIPLKLFYYQTLFETWHS